MSADVDFMFIMANSHIGVFASSGRRLQGRDSYLVKWVERSETHRS